MFSIKIPINIFFKEIYKNELIDIIKNTIYIVNYITKTTYLILNNVIRYYYNMQLDIPIIDIDYIKKIFNLFDIEHCNFNDSNDEILFQIINNSNINIVQYKLKHIKEILYKYGITMVTSINNHLRKYFKFLKIYFNNILKLDTNTPSNEIKKHNQKLYRVFNIYLIQAKNNNTNNNR